MAWHDILSFTPTVSCVATHNAEDGQECVCVATPSAGVPAQLPVSPVPEKPALHVQVRPAALSSAGAAESAHVASLSQALFVHASMSATHNAMATITA